MELWPLLLNDSLKLIVHEDNAAMIRVMETGRNPTMRHLGRTHGVSINWLHERFLEDWNELVKEDTTTMAGDVFTKAFDNKDKWTHACNLINVIDFTNITTQPRRGGGYGGT